MKCSVQGCPGEYEAQKITHTVRPRGQVVVIDQVPAEVCAVCGHTLFQPETVRRIEAILEAPQTSAARVPLYEYPTGPLPQRKPRIILWAVVVAGICSWIGAPLASPTLDPFTVMTRAVYLFLFLTAVNVVFLAFAHVRRAPLWAACIDGIVIAMAALHIVMYTPYVQD
jgi:YgiT-type zinc finger domain-containing protein